MSDIAPHEFGGINMKNVMKKIVIAVLNAASLLALVGCSDLSKDDASTSVSPSAKTCTVSGKVLVGGVSGATARTATSSLPTSDLTFSVYAYKGTGASIDTSESVDGTFAVETMTYSIALPQTGDWTIWANAYLANTSARKR